MFQRHQKTSMERKLRRNHAKERCLGKRSKLINSKQVFVYIFQGTEHLQKKIVNYELPADYKGFINVILGKIQLEINIHSLWNKYMSVQELRSTSKLFRSLKIKVKEKTWIWFEVIDFELNFENVWFDLVQYELVCFRLVWFGHYLFWFDQSCLSEFGLVWSSGWVWFSLVNPQTNKQNEKNYSISSI